MEIEGFAVPWGSDETKRAPMNSGLGGSLKMSFGALARAWATLTSVWRWPACWDRSRSYSSLICFANAVFRPGLSRLMTTGTARLASSCLLYTSDAADEEDSVDLGG